MFAAFVLAVVLADFTGYWKHRLFHLPGLWRFHAVHHSPRVVDWLSNERVHPVEGLATTALQLGPLLALGFSPLAIAGAAAFRRLHSLYEHGNLRIAYGVGERWLVSPHLHRWHHSSDPAAYHKNFANVFSLWEIGRARV